MHKVKFTIPRAISPENWASKDPKDYTADTAEGWMIDLEPEPLIFWKNSRGFWQIIDPMTGRPLITEAFKSRKDAMKAATGISYQLYEFKNNEPSKDHYAALAAVTEALAHELEIINRGRAE